MKLHNWWILLPFPAQWTTLTTPGANFNGALRYTDAAPPAGAAYYRLRPQ